MPARSGQITVANAGTAESGPDIPGTIFAVKAHPGNTGYGWVGQDGANDVAATNGYPVLTGEPPLIFYAGNLNELWFDTAENGEKLCWFRIA